MKNGSIEKIYYGTDCDADRELNERSTEQLNQEVQAANALFATLNPKQQEQYRNLERLQLARIAHETEIYYRRGFRSGAKMIMEVLTENE